MSMSAQRRTVLVMVGVLAAAVGLVGAVLVIVLSSGGDSQGGVAGPVGAGLADRLSSRAVASPHSSEPGSPENTADAPSAAVGDTAFDPCEVLRWSDFPESVRLADDVSPRPRPQGPEDVFEAACSFGYTDDTGERRFNTLVAVGREPTMSADPQLHRSEPVEWGGRTGTRKSANTENGPVCTGFVPVADTGVAGVSVATSPQLGVDPCVVVDALLTTLVSRVP